MNQIEDLENRLNVKNFIDELEIVYDNSQFSSKAKNPLDQLRKIKLFLYRSWDDLRKISEGTQLDATDCLTLATTAHLLAYRKGLETKVVRPTNITRYFHAMLEYEFNGESKIFKLSGRNRKYDSTLLLNAQIEKRINYIRPLVNMVNSIRFGDNTLNYTHR